MASEDDFDLVLPGGSIHKKAAPAAPAAPVQDDENFELAPVTNDFGKEGAKTPKQKFREEMMERGSMGPWESAIARGLSFGLSDRFIAGLQSALGKGSYEDELELQFSQRDALRAEHPVGSIAAEIGGGLLSGGPLVNAVKGVGSAALPGVARYAAGSGVGPALTRAAGVLGGGAAAGAVGGAGQADIGKTAEGAKSGAAMGALTAGALSAAGGAGKKFYDVALRTPVQHMKNIAGVAKPEHWAQDQWLKSVGLDGDDLAGLAAKMREADPQGKHGMMAMDVAGINAKSKLKAATVPETKARGELDQKLSQRMQERGGRLEELLSTHLSKRFDASQAADDIYRRGRERADPIYQQLRDMGEIGDDNVMAWINGNPVRRRMFDEYARSQAEIGKPLSMRYSMDDQGFLVKDKNPTWDDIHRIYKHLGDVRGQAYDKGEARLAGNTYNYDDISGEYGSLRELLNGISGGKFAEAQRLSGEAFEVQKALKAGQSMPNMSLEDLRKKFSELTSLPEQEAFRIGAASAIKARMEKADGINAVNKVYGKGMKEKLDILFPGQDIAAAFGKGMNAERTMAEAERQLLPKVQANMNAVLDDAADTNAMGAAAGFLSGHWGQGLGAMRRMFSRDWERAMPDYADPLLRFGMMGADEVDQLAQQIAARNSGALSKAGGWAGRQMGNAVRSMPYVGANEAAGLGGQIDLDSIFGPDE